MKYEEIIEHYSREDVTREIVDWCKDRWVSVHCERRDKKGKRLFLRYWPGRFRKPLTIRCESDLRRILNELKWLKPRSFYASINAYRSLSKEDDVFGLDNVYSSIPTWDIDNDLENWKATILVAKIIGEKLHENGIEKSVFYKWSGRGMHVHVHPAAFSRELTKKIHPLDLSFALVEFIRLKASDEIFKVKMKLKAEGLNVENKIDARRVFTVPLSFHRDLDIVTVCLKDENLDEFDLSWVQPKNFRHNDRWRDHKVGEADRLALKAYEVIGGCPYLGYRKRRRKTKPVEDMIRRFLDMDEKEK